MSKRRTTAPYIVETQKPDGSWREKSFELSPRMARKSLRDAEKFGLTARIVDNPDYKPPPPKRT